MFECRERLCECTIRLEYASFLTTIAFRRVDNVWDSTIFNLKSLLPHLLLFNENIFYNDNSGFTTHFEYYIFL